MTADGELSIQLAQHARGWLLVRVALPFLPRTPLTLDLMLNTGRPQSALSVSMERALLTLGLLEARGDRTYTLAHAEADGQPLPPIIVRASRGPGLLHVDGMLGLDFLAQFARACLDSATLRLTLTR